MSINIQPCKPGDAEDMIIAGEAAFADDDLNNAIFNPRNGTPEEVAEYRAWRIARSRQRQSGEGKFYFKAVDESNGRIVGYVGLFTPSVDIGAQQPSAARPACMNVEFEKATMERLDAVEKKWIGDRKDVWYVPSMCVHPEYQGQGIAKRLLQRGLEEVDKLGQDVLLEGTTAALKLYRSCGFELLEEVVLLDGRYTLGIMMRRSKGVASAA